MNDGCPACGKGLVGICPDCEILARTEITVSRAAWPTWLAMGTLLLLIGLVVWLAYETEYVGVTVRLIYLLAIPIAILLGWIRSSLKRPIRLTIHKDVVEFDLLFGPDRWIQVGNLDTRLGRLHLLETRERIPVGEVWFPGAGRFHRALRARLAMMGAEEESTGAVR